MLSLPYSDPHSAEQLRYLDAQQLRQQIFLAVRDLFLAETRCKPLMLILEDLHWADEASLELLQFLLESVPKAPVFILAISRRIQDGALRRSAEWAQAHLAERFVHLPAAEPVAPAERAASVSAYLHSPPAQNPARTDPAPGGRHPALPGRNPAYADRCRSNPQRARALAA